MGIIESSKYQALFVGGPKATNGKGNKNNQKTKFDSPNKKEKIQQHDEPSNSRKNKNKGRQNKENIKCSYSRKGFHPKHSCMKKKLDEMTLLLKQKNINLPDRLRKRNNPDENI